MLKIEQNIEEAVYIKQRRNSLLNARNAEPEIPLSLKEHIRLKDHQREGVAWLQQLFLRSPQETAGCLLADDMGLGKTLQILTFWCGSLKNSLTSHQVSSLPPSLFWITGSVNSTISSTPLGFR